MTPLLPHFWPFLDIYGNLEPNNSMKIMHFVFILSLIHLYYILVKLEHLDDVIGVVIDDFLFLTQLFASFLDIYGNLKPNNSMKMMYLVFLLALIHLYYILVELEHLDDVIGVVIDDFVFLSPHFASFFSIFFLLIGSKELLLLKKYFILSPLHTYTHNIMIYERTLPMYGKF